MQQVNQKMVKNEMVQTKPLILILDPHVAYYTEFGANFSDFSVRWFDDSVSALKAVAMYHPYVSLVLLDPGLEDGVGVLGAIKSDFPEIPVVVFTDKKLRFLHAFELQADGELSKQTSFEDVCVYLERFLRARGVV